MDILDGIETIEDDVEELDENDLDELNEDDFGDEGDEGDSLELISDDDLDFEMSEEKAREITDAIRAHATATYVLLSQAYAGKAHKALGYGTWADYVKTEFDLSASRSYQLLDLSRVVNEIEEVTPEGTVVKLTEAQARDIKRELPKITEQIREETEGLDPEDASEAVDRIVKDIRDQKIADDKAIQEREQRLDEAKQEGYQQGLEAAADAMLEADAARNGDYSGSGDYDGPAEQDDIDVLSPQDKVDLYNFLNVLSSLISLPDPDGFINVIPSGRDDEISNQINEATTWLNRFSTLWELRVEDN